LMPSSAQVSGQACERYAARCRRPRGRRVTPRTANQATARVQQEHWSVRSGWRGTPASIIRRCDSPHLPCRRARQSAQHQDQARYDRDEDKACPCVTRVHTKSRPCLPFFSSARFEGRVCTNYLQYWKCVARDVAEVRPLLVAVCVSESGPHPLIPYTQSPKLGRRPHAAAIGLSRRDRMTTLRP
jgi:hypothetical protein